MKTSFNFIYSSFLLILAFAMVSCSNDDPQNARLQVVLVDAPAEYDGVLVDVQGVSANFNSQDETSEEDNNEGWSDITTADFEPGQIDLLELVNGSEAMLADETIPVGTLSEIRLLLGENNKLVIGTEELDLTVPSGSSSGLKIKLDAEIKGGITYKLILDFDAARSVVATGSGKYNLKPVIHARMEAQTGAISGDVQGLEGGVVVYAIAGEDSVSTYPNDLGEFLIQALEAGTYNVVAVPEADLEPVTVEGVPVTVGEISSAGTLSFE